MTNCMKEALKSALQNILSMTPEELLAEADKIKSGVVYEFVKEFKINHDIIQELK